MMGTADVTTPPSLPAFMVSRSQGLALRDRVAPPGTAGGSGSGLEVR